MRNAVSREAVDLFVISERQWPRSTRIAYAKAQRLAAGYANYTGDEKFWQAILKRYGAK